MSAFFIRKQDLSNPGSYNFFLRLDDGTTEVKFHGASEAGATYTLKIDGSEVIRKTGDSAILVSTGFTPVPTGPGQVYYPRDNVFPGAGVTRTYSNSSVAEFPVTFTSSLNNSQLRLGGTIQENAGPGVYAYPGQQYLLSFRKLHIKDSGVWRNPDKIHIHQGGSWREVETVFIKHNNEWKIIHYYDTFSKYINIEEGGDDTLDFCIYVEAVN